MTPAGSFEFDVHVRPGGRSDDVEGDYGGRLAVRVRAAPESGKANQAVIEVVAAAFLVPRSDVGLVSGRRGRRKRIRVSGDMATLKARHADLMASG